MAIHFSKSVLGLVLVRGTLHARVLQGGEVVASWDAPGPLAGLDGLREALEQVPEQTGFRGESVVVAIASSQMEHQMVKLPPMREHDMEAFLSRKVRHFAVEAGRQAWSWHVLHGGKIERQVALHLIPLSLIHVFLDFCRSRNYQVEQVVPLASTLAWSARSLPLQKGQWGLVAAELGSATTIVVADPEGRMALVRELSFGLAEPDAADRFSKELNRSILFAKQQFGIGISGVWISGVSLQDTPSLLSKSVADIQISPLPVADPPAFWLRPLVGLDPDIHDNMVPRSMRRLNEHRRHLETIFVVVLAVHLFLLATILGLKTLGDDTRSNVSDAHVAERIASLHEEKSVLEHRLGEISGFETQASGIAASSWDPKPGWLLGWVGANLPDQLRLEALVVDRPEDSTSWHVRLQGTSPREAVAASRSLREFQERLEHGAPRLSISRSWEEQWHSNLRTGATWDNDTLGKPFVIEGTLR